LDRGIRTLIGVYYPYRKTPVRFISGIRMSNRILVIEDDEETRELMRMALEKRGYEVTVAGDGVRGYDTALFLKPDLIVTDIQMPGADGVHVVRRVRDTASLAKTPILVTTAFGTGTATFSLQLGANAYEPKPIDLQSFLTTVRRLLADRDSIRAA
jgi:CheY-like chemotaxis protein